MEEIEIAFTPDEWCLIYDALLWAAVDWDDDADAECKRLTSKIKQQVKVIF